VTIGVVAKFLGPEFDKVPEVPLFSEIPEFPYNKVQDMLKDAAMPEISSISPHVSTEHRIVTDTDRQTRSHS